MILQSMNCGYLANILVVHRYSAYVVNGVCEARKAFGRLLRDAFFIDCGQSWQRSIERFAMDALCEHEIAIIIFVPILNDSGN
jgi:hypothetical protein